MKKFQPLTPLGYALLVVVMLASLLSGPRLVAETLSGEDGEPVVTWAFQARP